MSTIDLLKRVNGIIEKYEKYDASTPKERPANASQDYFMKLYRTIEDDLNDVLKKVEEVEHERNRAVIATLNAEVRRSKAALRLELLKLHKLAQKKVKGVIAEEILTRPSMALALAARIEEVPDGVNAIRKKNPANGQPLEIRIDNYSPDDIMRSGAGREHSVESKGFSDEYELRKIKQDEGLEAIQQGLTTLKDMAHDIGEELSRQEQLVDEADTKTDQASANMNTTNSRLKESVTAMRSSRNFCIDITLLVIILGIAAYLYKALKK
ncbi:hypothetical protein KC19_VG022000 [Ceratodon purpureus]|uniref:t-SNARE coiled-coil homology domain-containing protein n=1 Tax=Ceratodon purpureus TaxID=3225 RepID=A0A8T0HL78_CERPU|nr:hypothetical protein KC19_VG022000 [Ceratodon purpureus]